MYVCSRYECSWMKVQQFSKLCCTVLLFFFYFSLRLPEVLLGHFAHLCSCFMPFNSEFVSLILTFLSKYYSSKFLELICKYLKVKLFLGLGRKQQHLLYLFFPSETFGSALCCQGKQRERRVASLAARLESGYDENVLDSTSKLPPLSV